MRIPMSVLMTPRCAPRSQVPILATKIERHSTFAEKEVSMMAKMCFFQVRGIAAPLSPH